jgi:hypothetical protein
MQDEDSLLNRKHTTCVLSFFHDNVYMLFAGSSRSLWGRRQCGPPPPPRRILAGATSQAPGGRLVSAGRPSGGDSRLHIRRAAGSSRRLIGVGRPCGGDSRLQI